MLDFRPLWTERANNKNVTFVDCIQRCILLGMHKGDTQEEKVQHALKHLDRSFSPSSRWRYSNLVRQTLTKAVVPAFGIAGEVLESKEEMLEFGTIARECCKPANIKRLGVHYTCIYLLGKLIPEQVVIQGMHASMQLGQKLTREQAWPKGCNASNLHYLLVRAENPGDICQFLIRHGVWYSIYEDYDYFFDNNGTLLQSDYKTVKSIMTYPVPGWKKEIFDDLELLRFESVRSD